MKKTSGAFLASSLLLISIAVRDLLPTVVGIGAMTGSICGLLLVLWRVLQEPPQGERW